MGTFEPEQFGRMMAALDVDAGGVDRIEVAEEGETPAG
jgi:hypothetical protein